MKNYATTIVMLTVLISLYGCNGNSDSTSPTAEIDGTWVAAENNDTVTIDNGKLAYENDFDAYPNGTTDVHIRGVRLLTITGSKIIQPNNLAVKTFDTEVYSYYLTPTTLEYTNFLNSINWCNFSDYMLDVEKDLTVCTQESWTGEKNIYYLEGDILTFGDMNQTGSDGYPDALAVDQNYTRQ